MLAERPRSADEPGEELLDLEREGRRTVDRRVRLEPPAPSTWSAGHGAQRQGQADDRLGVGDARRRRSVGRHVAERHPLDRHVLLLEALAVGGAPRSGRWPGRRRSARRRSPASCGTRPGASSRPACEPDLLDQLPRRGDLGRLAGDVALAGGDLEQLARRARPGTGAPARPCSSSSQSGTTDTAPGWRTTSRSKRRAVGGLERAPGPPRSIDPGVDRSARRPARKPGGSTPAGSRQGADSATARRVVEVEQVRVAALGPAERGADELAEQRGGPVGPALELGMGLGADPERVARRAR